MAGNPFTTLPVAPEIFYCTPGRRPPSPSPHAYNAPAKQYFHSARVRGLIRRRDAAVAQCAGRGDGRWRRHVTRQAEGGAVRAWARGRVQARGSMGVTAGAGTGTGLERDRGCVRRGGLGAGAVNGAGAGGARANK
ncbi:hypothetical protein GGX14DRAFT_397809 [Mycena pura]|uniref:Uncharacterized protein n=1 Tax=Mycena pura TaxID=153505 RepID=A0AAD6Y798_9AGAR|nr:hypothetical protein GGX14DRAFT_397809 [Mycena pura]